MPTPPQDPAPFAAAPLSETARAAAAARDDGMRRVRRTTRWLLAGALGLTGAVAGLSAQQTLPVSASSANDRATAAVGAVAGEEQDDEGGSASVQAPAQAPQAAASSVTPSASTGAS